MAQRLLLLLTCFSLVLLTACATKSYQHENAHSYPLRERAVVQSEGGVSISASVPGQNEAEAIFGVPLYKRGIQPVWLEIVNQSSSQIRFAPISLDRYYFSPLEVSYMHRKGYSKSARATMDTYFYQSAMPRQIPAGETRSGFVFTHFRPGTKSFNVDIFSADEDHSFTFFVTVPGFVPDHSEVDFDALYSESDRADYDLAGLQTALQNAPLITTDRTGQLPGKPVNIVIIGEGEDILQALLRAGWYESPGVQDEDQLEKAQFLYGRSPDAVFRIQRDHKRDRNEMYLWMSPMLHNGENVWMAQIKHFIGRKTELEEVFLGAIIDPDLNDGRDFFIQNLWYAQGLEKLGWLKRHERIPIEESRTDFNGSEYFSDGFVIVTWLSGKPVSLTETQRVNWDDPPYTP
jgi:hypothetical protein